MADRSDATPPARRQPATAVDAAVSDAESESESAADGDASLADEQTRPSGAVAAQASAPSTQEVVPDRDPEAVTMADGTRFSLTNDGGGRNHRIRVHDRDNQRVRSYIGTGGTGPGEFVYPCALASDPDGNLVVADFGNGRVQVLTAYGEFVRSFGSPGIGPGEMLGPCGLEVDDQGRVYVADALSTRVQLFDQSGRVIGQWGSAAEDPFASFFGAVAQRLPGDMVNKPVTVDVSGDTLVVVRHPHLQDEPVPDPQWRYRIAEMTPPDVIPAAAPPIHTLNMDSYPGFVSLANRVPEPYIDRLRERFRDPSGMSPHVYFVGAFPLTSPTAPGREVLITAVSAGGNYGFCDFAVWRPGERTAVWSMNRPGQMYPTDRPDTFAIATRFSFQNEAHAHERLQYIQFFEWDGTTVRMLPERRVREWRFAVDVPSEVVPVRIEWPDDDDPTWVPWADDAPEGPP